jgi:hypothetical protein
MIRSASEGPLTYHLEELDFAAESELKIALMFADLSLAAYRVGRLRRACDARSKAESLCSKAAAHLNLMQACQRSESMLRELLDKLAGLPEFKFQTRAAS